MNLNVQLHYKLCVVALFVCLCPVAGHAWGPHPDITRAAVETLRGDDAIIKLLGVEKSNLPQNSNMPDWRRTLHRDKSIWYYTDDYLLFARMLQHKDHKCPDVKDTYEPYFRRALQAMRTESVSNAGRWIGSLIHFVEDTGAPPHAEPINGDLHNKLENWDKPQDLHISGYRPRSLGKTDDEALAGLRKRLDQLIEFSKQRAERAKPFAQNNDRRKTDEILIESAQECARLVADLLLTLGDLAQNIPADHNATLRGRINSKAGAGLERVPAKVMLMGTPYATLCDEDGWYVFRHLPAGEVNIAVARVCNVVTNETVTLPGPQQSGDKQVWPETAKDFSLQSDNPDQNMVRNATLSLSWIQPDRPDFWYKNKTSSGEPVWEGELLPVRSGLNYRLEVAWQNDAAGKVGVRLFGTDLNKPSKELKPIEPGQTKIEFSGNLETTHAQVVIYTDKNPAKVCKKVTFWNAGYEKSEYPVCNRIRFYPAPSTTKSLVGGRFEGSNVSGTDGFELLTEIKSEPKDKQWTDLRFENHRVYRWLRYVGAEGSYCKIAEIEFYSGNRQLGPGGNFGTVVPGHNWQDAFDQNTKSWFESDKPKGSFVAMDLRETATARNPKFTPDPDLYDGAVNVKIKSSPDQAVIRYTVDGTLPTLANGYVYEGPLRLDRSMTFQAVAFQEGRAPSVPITAVYLIQHNSKPGLKTMHIGNGLTQLASQLKQYSRTYGYTHDSFLYTRQSANTKELWEASQTQDKERFDALWRSISQIDHLTVQPRNFNINEEAEFDRRWFDLARKKSPYMQPWLFCEWAEMKRDRAPDKGEVQSSQMSKVYPALTWEESMGAMLLYVEEVQKKVLEKYKDGNRPRVLPTALMMGWMKNLIDQGKIPGLAPGSFYPALFHDQINPSVNALSNQHGNGAFLVDMTWYAAFYHESPLDRVLPIYTTFTPEQVQIIQRLAWDVVKNYPDCGLYEEGSSPCGKPEFSPQAGAIGEVTRVTLSSSTPDAWFRYTLDGTDPTRTNGYVYCGVISVRPGMTVKAIAYKSGMSDSGIGEAGYPTKN